MRRATLIAASAGFILAGLASADVVGNIEFGTEFTPIPSTQSYGFSSQGLRLGAFGESGGGHHSSGYYLDNAYLLVGASELFTFTGFATALVTEGYDLNTLDRGGFGFDTYMTLTRGENAGEGPETNSRTVNVAHGTPWFIGLETEGGQRGFVQLEYEYVLKIPGMPEYGGNAYTRLVGWAIELDPSDDSFYTFDVRNGIPSPAGVGLLGVAGLVGLRRRRASSCTQTSANRS